MGTPVSTVYGRTTPALLMVTQPRAVLGVPSSVTFGGLACPKYCQMEAIRPSYMSIPKQSLFARPAVFAAIHVGRGRGGLSRWFAISRALALYGVTALKAPQLRLSWPQFMVFGASQRVVGGRGAGLEVSCLDYLRIGFAIARVMVRHSRENEDGSMIAKIRVVGSAFASCLSAIPIHPTRLFTFMDALAQTGAAYCLALTLE